MNSWDFRFFIRSPVLSFNSFTTVTNRPVLRSKYYMPELSYFSINFCSLSSLAWEVSVRAKFSSLASFIWERVLLNCDRLIQHVLVHMWRSMFSLLAFTLILLCLKIFRLDQCSSQLYAHVSRYLNLLYDARASKIWISRIGFHAFFTV